MAIVPTGGSFTLPFVARDEQLFQMWMFLHSNYEDLQSGNLPVGRPVNGRPSCFSRHHRASVRRGCFRSS
ncbi:unnamed protein product, partial [Phaeothamnion confervicola]